MKQLRREEVKSVVEEIKKRTATEAFSITIDYEKQPGLFDSKFGGLPYWDLKKSYPVTDKGEKLVLLAQINLDELEFNEKLPTSGMLQFFILMDDVYGLDFDEPDKQNTFRVVYHEVIERSVTREQILELNLPTSDDFDGEFPVLKECAVSVKKQMAYMTEEDYRFNKLFGQIMSEQFHMRKKYILPYEVIGDEDFSEMEEELGNGGHWMLGYPFFTQEDPRSEGTYEKYDTLLFQMDSDYEDEDYVMWGDSGVANFFINYEDLKKKDFSKILYNWDCC